MDNIENIIERYRRELMEFNLQNPQAPPEDSQSVAPPFYAEAVSQNIEVRRPETDDNSFKPYQSYDDFLKDNTQTGALRVQVFGADRAFPISGAEVNINLPLANEESVNLFDGLTDINGIVDNIVVPAPSSELSQSPENPQIKPYATYKITVRHPLYADSEFLSVPVFSGVKSIQGVELIPLSASGEAPDSPPVLLPEPYLNLRGIDLIGNTDNS